MYLSNLQKREQGSRYNCARSSFLALGSNGKIILGQTEEKIWTNLIYILVSYVTLLIYQDFG
jgi:hypothetical protein